MHNHQLQIRLDIKCTLLDASLSDKSTLLTSQKMTALVLPSSKIKGVFVLETVFLRNQDLGYDAKSLIKK